MDSTEYKERKRKISLNIKANENSIAVIFDDISTHNALFTVADVLHTKHKHIKNKQKIVMYYKGSVQSEFFETLRYKYSMLPQQNMSKYEFRIQSISDTRLYTNEGNLRNLIIKGIKETHPKLIILGVQCGLTMNLLQSENDLSFRECAAFGTIPVIIKENQIREKHRNYDSNGGQSSRSYSNSNWAFQIDFTDDSMYALTVMLPFIKCADKLNLIWIKPDIYFASSDGESNSVHMIFKPFIQLIKTYERSIFKNIIINTYIFNQPHVGHTLCDFVNNSYKKEISDDIDNERIHFLVVYCDLMNNFIRNHKVIGSVSDYCVRHSKCPVIIPAKPRF